MYVFFGLNVWKKKLIDLDTKIQKQNAECKICATRLIIEILLCFLQGYVRFHYSIFGKK